MRAWVLSVAMGVLAAVAVGAVVSQPVDLVPGEPSFRRLVGGATPSGRVLARALVSVPGVPRGAPGEVRIVVEAPTLRLGIDGAPLANVRPNRDGVVVMELPRAASPGARIMVGPGEGEPPLALRRIQVRGAPPALWPPALAFLLAFAAALAMARRSGPRLGAACGVAAGAFCALVATPSVLWLSLPAGSATLRLAVPLTLFGASLALGGRSRSFRGAAALLAALVFGSWVRLYFLPSAGSWDTEYWKAWTARAVSAGVSRVYGDSDATPPGRFTAHLLGREDLYQIEYRGRRFVVDYPPLAMALWRWSWMAVSTLAPGLDRGEAENVAVKLPAVLGDVLAVVLLLFLFRQSPRRGLTVAALYWALPVSWVSSAVLGFLDAAVAPLAVLGLVAAGRGRAASAGALVALAGLVKPQGLIVAPAAMLALYTMRASLARGVASGLGVVGLAMIPFALAGTLAEAVTHVFRILFQQRLSAGFANVWWALGHLANGASIGAPVEYARIDALPFPAAFVGTSLFALAVAFVLYRLRSVRGPEAACLAGGALLFAYAILAMGVHENHPHSMFLAFAATGLASLRLRFLVGVLATSYVLNMLSLSVLGRFYGSRYMALEPVAGLVSRLRMALGLDGTLLLAVLNTILLAWFLASLRSELRLLQEPR